MRDQAVEPSAAPGPAGHLHGLTVDEALRRLEEHGPNVLPPADRPGLGRRLLRELREPMALLLLAAAAISGVALGERLDAAAIATIVVVNAVIALVQEGRAERALESLVALEAPAATVLRDGRPRRVAAAEVVPGDVAVVQAGDRVPADLDLLEATALEVDESLLTGESLPVTKRAGGATDHDRPIGDRDGALHSGTMVSRGAAVGVVTATGTHTALGAIAERLRTVGDEPTPLQRQLAALTRRLGVAAVVIASAMFALTLQQGDPGDVQEAFLTAVALAVAAVPEGLATVTTVALALGVRRMAQLGAIIRRLPAVETLGATDVLVIDKTGTVTQNRMVVAAVVDAEGAAHAAGDVPPALRREVELVAVLCNDATVDPPTGDPTERALLDVSDPGTVDELRDRHPRLGLAPFTAERKRMSTLTRVDGGLRLLVKGAPEVLLPRCAWTSRGGAPAALTPEAREQLLVLTGDRAARGERVLALATRDLPVVPDPLEDAETSLRLVGFLALRDPPRASATASVEAVQRAGVTLLMATGDHPATAAAIATEVGLGAGQAVSGGELRAGGLPHDPTGVPVFARVDPDQKLALVDRLQELGHTVAMTGDGVNDAPALRSADIGVALGASGSDVAREAADLVITDDDLGTIVAAIREGRGIYDNLRKVIDYLVSSNLAEVAVVVVTLLLFPALGVPLFPLQLLWINLLTDGLPAVALGVDPVSPQLMDRPPRPARARLLDGPHLRRLTGRAVVLAASAVGALAVALEVLDLPDAEARTILFTTLVVAQVLYAAVVRRSGGVRPAEPNRWLRLATGVALALQVAAVTLPPAQRVFDTVSPSAEGWVLALGAGVLAPLVLRLVAGTSALRPPSPSPGGDVQREA